MINLTKGQTQIIYFTATEKCTAASPSFLFIFTHRITGESIHFTVTNNSTHTARYDKASISVDSEFSGATEGFWSYEIKEEAGGTVETGYMILNPATPFAPTEYSDQDNSFTTYNG